MKEKPYQDFGGGGSSDSPRKLAELGLPDDMSGTRVLDLGCNAGYFCIESAKRGAELAVGIEARAKFFEAAKENAAAAGVSDQCRFILGDWNDVIPSLDERFDFVFWLAAMHYEKRPMRMANWIRSKMNPSGTLVLDVGVMASVQNHSDWFKLPRPETPDSYPSLKMLHRIFPKFALRFHTHSESLPNQGKRFIFHGAPRRPIVLLIGGETGSGKTVLADTITGDAVRISVDALLSQLDRQEMAPNEFGRTLETFRQQSESLLKHQKRLVAHLSSVNEARGLIDLAKLLCHPVNLDSDLFVIEGGLLSLPEFRRAVKKVLGSGYVIWGADRI